MKATKKTEASLVLFRGAVGPDATQWATDDEEAANQYAEEVHGTVYRVTVHGPVAPLSAYPRLLNGFDPETGTLDFDSECDAVCDGYSAIGPIEDISGCDRRHKSWVIVDGSQVTVEPA